MKKETHYLSDSGFRLVVADDGSAELVEPVIAGREPVRMDLSIGDLQTLADLLWAAAERRA